MIKNIKPEEFVKNHDNYKKQIINANNRVQTTLENLCNIDYSQKLKIKAIRKEYQDRLNQANRLGSNFLNNEIHKLKAFLTKGVNIYKSYENNNFCQKAKEYKEKMGNLGE